MSIKDLIEKKRLPDHTFIDRLDLDDIDIIEINEFDKPYLEKFTNLTQLSMNQT